MVPSHRSKPIDAHRAQGKYGLLGCIHAAVLEERVPKSLALLELNRLGFVDLLRPRFTILSL